MAACSTSGGAGTPISAAPNGTSALTQTSVGGQVTVVVDWVGPTGGTVFDVTLDTHSVDLDALDLSDALLRNDRAESMTPTPWAAPAGGHHRQGSLAFAGDPASFLRGAQWIELMLSGIGDLPTRTLRWDVGP